METTFWQRHLSLLLQREGKQLTIIVDIGYPSSKIHPPFYMANIAQLVRALDCGSGGHGFEPHYSPLLNNQTFGFDLTDLI